MARAGPEVQYRQARPRVYANPLAGDAAAHEQPGQRQIRQKLFHRGHHDIPLNEAQHEQVAQDDEQHREAVDGGDARLCQVHAVQGHHGHGGKSHVRALGQLLAQHIHRREHQDARHRPGDAPAEGRHAEDGDAHAHQQLAQRRMGGFIGGRAPQMLQGRAGMVDLIEVGAVVPAGLVLLLSPAVQARYAFDGVLLVQQMLRIRQKGRSLVGVDAIHHGGRNGVALRVSEDDLVEDQADLLGGDAHVPTAEAFHLIRIGG